MAIHQFLPSFRLGDAIGNYTVHIAETIRSWGVDSDIFCEFFNPDTMDIAHYYKKYSQVKQPDDILLFHFSIGADMTKYILAQDARKVMIYHNITPADYFKDYNPVLFQEVKKGRIELARMKDRFDLYLSDSPYNNQELQDLGFAPAHVLPLTLDWRAQLAGSSNRIYDRMFADGKTNLLFTGKISPQKRILDLIKVFYFYRTQFNQDSRLILMGENRGAFCWYYLSLLKLIQDLDLPDVVFVGFTTHKQWVSLFNQSHIFLVFSGHEGFCAPAMEAMVAGLPVVSVKDCALKDTVGTGGVVLQERDYLGAAALVHRLVSDQPLRGRVLANQESRVKDYFAKDFSATLKGYMEMLA